LDKKGGAMTRDDIIRMAREAGGEDWGIFRDFMPELERFAQLVAEHEREECAQIAFRAFSQLEATMLIRERGAP